MGPLQQLEGLNWLNKIGHNPVKSCTAVTRYNVLMDFQNIFNSSSRIVVSEWSKMIDYRNYRQH